MGNLGRITWWTGHAAPLLAIVAAVLGLGGVMFKQLDHPVALGVTGALSGVIWWADSVLRNRLAKEQAARQELFERTPPALEFVDAKLVDGALVAAIRSNNRVPFSCNWVCVTTANQVVGGIMTQNAEVFPDALVENTLVLSYPLQLARIADNYLELRFRYHSVYSAKFGNPAELAQRTLTVAWQMSQGALARVERRQEPAASR